MPITKAPAFIMWLSEPDGQARKAGRSKLAPLLGLAPTAPSVPGAEAGSLLFAKGGPFPTSVTQVSLA